MSIKPEGKALHFFCRVAVGLLSLALAFATAAPLLRSDAWWIRVFDFPRIQIAALMGLTLAMNKKLTRPSAKGSLTNMVGIKTGMEERLT